MPVVRRNAVLPPSLSVCNVFSSSQRWMMLRCHTRGDGGGCVRLREEGWGRRGGLQEGSGAGIWLHLPVNRAAVGNGSTDPPVLGASASTCCSFRFIKCYSEAHAHPGVSHTWTPHLILTCLLKTKFRPRKFLLSQNLVWFYVDCRVLWKLVGNMNQNNSSGQFSHFLCIFLKHRELSCLSETQLSSWRGNKIQLGLFTVNFVP